MNKLLSFLNDALRGPRGTPCEIDRGLQAVYDRAYGVAAEVASEPDPMAELAELQAQITHRQRTYRVFMHMAHHDFLKQGLPTETYRIVKVGPKPQSYHPDKGHVVHLTGFRVETWKERRTLESAIIPPRGNPYGIAYRNTKDMLRYELEVLNEPLESPFGITWFTVHTGQPDGVFPTEKDARAWLKQWLSKKVPVVATFDGAGKELAQ